MNEQTKNVVWNDLLSLSRYEVFYELTLSLPWLLASLFFATKQNYFLALACSFMFFLTGLRQVHNAFHDAVGISKKLTQWLMFGLSMVMLGSMHAVKINHLRHHRYCMQAEDIEATSARMSWWQAILFGPIFPFLLHRKALQVANKEQQKWIYAELTVNVLILSWVFLLQSEMWLKYHFATMLIAQCLTAFFAVWTVHHDCDEQQTMGRTIHGHIKAKLTYNMFFHTEHHLFPRVPTCKLHIVAQRLNHHAPELRLKSVF